MPCYHARCAPAGRWPCVAPCLCRLLAAACSLALCATAHGDSRPNVILVISDDQGYGDLSLHGNPALATPTLDRFASEGVRLNQFYVSPVCSPTRSSLLTGRYSYRTGVVDTYLGRSLMYGDETTLAECLRQAGYRTGICGKWHLGDNHPLRPQDQGFDEALVHRSGGIGQVADPPGNHYGDPWLLENGRVVRRIGFCTEVFTDAAIDFVERHARVPFFLYLAYNCPHTPLEVPLPALRQVEFFRQLAVEPPEIPLARLSPEETTARVYALVQDLDQQFDRLLAAVRSQGLEERTIVVFLTDNGPQQPRFNGPFRGLKGTVLEGGIHVPCFARWPGRWSPGKQLDVPAAHIDWLPTLLAACQVPLPHERPLDGVDLGPWLRGDNLAAGERTLFVQYHRGDTPERFRSCAVRRGAWKLVQPAGAREEPLPADWHFELYNLVEDPGETRDRAAEQPRLVAELRAAYERWFEQMQAERQFLPPRIVVGTDQENPVTLTQQDWRGPRSDWAGEGPGHWQLRVARAGTYRIRLRFAATAVPVNATCQLGETLLAAELPAGAVECVWPAVTLPSGELRLQATLEQQPRPAGPRYVDLWRIASSE